LVTYQSVSEIFFYSKQNLGRYDLKCTFVFTWSTRYSCQILIELEFPRHIFEKYWNIKFDGNPFRGRRVVPCGWTYGRTDGYFEANSHFRNFAKAPKKISFHVFGSPFFLLSWFSVLSYPSSHLWKQRKIIHISSLKIVFSKSETREHFAICLTH
jgi:hypothetical protein